MTPSQDPDLVPGSFPRLQPGATSVVASAASPEHHPAKPRRLGIPCRHAAPVPLPTTKREKHPLSPKHNLSSAGSSRPSHAWQPTCSRQAHAHGELAHKRAARLGEYTHLLQEDRSPCRGACRLQRAPGAPGRSAEIAALGGGRMPINSGQNKSCAVQGEVLRRPLVCLWPGGDPQRSAHLQQGPKPRGF